MASHLRILVDGRTTTVELNGVDVSDYVSALTLDGRAGHLWQATLEVLVDRLEVGGDVDLQLVGHTVVMP